MENPLGNSTSHLTSVRNTHREVTLVHAATAVDAVPGCEAGPQAGISPPHEVYASSQTLSD